MTEQAHGNAAIEAFFDRWEVYQRVIENDYMAHRGIHAAIRNSLSSSRKVPFSVMDLGCGDGSVIAETLRGLPVERYVGVDLSGVALELAKKSFKDSSFARRFVQSNLTEYLAGSDAECVDVVIAGFAVHHLRNDEKRAFFSDCFGKLSRGGDLYLFDVFRRPGQSREEYLDAYCSVLEHDWTEISKDERDDICGHIRKNDFPVSYEIMSDVVRAAGFDVPTRPAYVDKNGFHRLYHFTLQE